MASVFQKFGGIRPMAAKLGNVPPSTVKSWHAKGQIPAWRHGSILEAARRHGVTLSAAELVTVRPDDPDAEGAERATDTPFDDAAEPALAQAPAQ